MKNLITAILLTFVSFTAQAANGGTNLSSEASDIARRMANQIELNELEYIQVRNYTIEKLETVSQIKDLYASNPMMMDEKLVEVETNYTYRIQNLLNAKQFDNYMALSNSFKTQHTLIATTEE